MRTLNPDRTRRHMYRSTPDISQFEINQIDIVQDDYKIGYYKWISKFSRAMQLKYGPDIQIDVYTDNQIGYARDKVVCTAIVVRR